MNTRSNEVATSTFSILPAFMMAAAKRTIFPALLLAVTIGTVSLLVTGINKAVAGNMSEEKSTLDIVDTAVASGNFNTLVAAVQAADLVETLKSEGPFTVFAPTDEAFAKIPQDKLNALLEDKKALIDILTYHVVPGKVMAADVVNLESAQTVQGQSITVDASEGVKIDNATVIQADIEATNGVIHVIDAVIMPKS